MIIRLPSVPSTTSLDDAQLQHDQRVRPLLGLGDDFLSKATTYTTTKWTDGNDGRAMEGQGQGDVRAMPG